MQHKSHRMATTVLSMAALAVFAPPMVADVMSVAYQANTPGLGSTLGSFDLTTGVYNPVPAGHDFYDLAYSPTGTLYAVDTSGNLGTLTTAGSSFNFTQIAALSNPNIYALAFNGSGTLYGTDGVTLFSVDPSTAAATAIGPLGNAIDSLTGGVWGIRFDEAGDLLAVAYDANNAFSVDLTQLWNVDTSTGTASFLNSPTDSAGNPLIDLMPGLIDGTFYGVGMTSKLSNGFFAADTGATFSFAGSPPNVGTTLANSNAFVIFAAGVPVDNSGPGNPPPSTIPEPAGFVLCATGLAAAALIRKRLC